MTLSKKDVVVINTDTFREYKCLFTQTIRDWNDLHDSLIFSAEMSYDGVSRECSGIIPYGHSPSPWCGIIIVNYSGSDLRHGRTGLHYIGIAGPFTT